MNNQTIIMRFYSNPRVHDEKLAWHADVANWSKGLRPGMHRIIEGGWQDYMQSHSPVWGRRSPVSINTILKMDRIERWSH